jgi:hypothetical protein
MAIQPIDAQVLFSRLNQLGKEQAEQKDGQMHTQVVQGAQTVRRAEEADHMVNKTPEAEGDNVRQVKDESRRHGQRRGKSGGDGETEEDQDDEVRQETLKESYLGKKIDITG